MRTSGTIRRRRRFRSQTTFQCPSGCSTESRARQACARADCRHACGHTCVHCAGGLVRVLRMHTSTDCGVTGQAYRDLERCRDPNNEKTCFYNFKVDLGKGPFKSIFWIGVQGAHTHAHTRTRAHAKMSAYTHRHTTAHMYESIRSSRTNIYAQSVQDHPRE